jgi:hypothetical protein
MPERTPAHDVLDMSGVPPSEASPPPPLFMMEACAPEGGFSCGVLQVALEERAILRSDRRPVNRLHLCNNQPPPQYTSNPC